MNDIIETKYITFKIDKDIYAINISHVIEIVGLQEIIEMPDMPDIVQGVINLRGRIIPIVDARRRLKKNEKNYDETSSIIILNIKETFFGLVVDKVEEVIELDEANLATYPNITDDQKLIKLIGIIQNRLYLIIDVYCILNNDTFIKISEVG